MANSLFTHQRFEFNNQFRSRFGDGFQEWFAKLVRRMHPPGDIQEVRLTQGDAGLDVVILNDQVVYQCYGPQTFRSSEAAEKIESDFRGAYEFLEGRMRRWVFVHNHPTGKLDKLCILALNKIVQQCADRGEHLEVHAWGIEDLWDALETGVPFHVLRDLFGSPDPVHVDYACLEELLLHLERATYPDDAEPVSLPDERKLDFNDLGPAYRREIREGRNGLRVLEGYLTSRAGSDPEFAERLAQRFRNCYQNLRSRSARTADEIYENLRLDAGWQAKPDVKREMATRSVLAYFFDSCDIFENPPVFS